MEIKVRYDRPVSDVSTRNLSLVGPTSPNTSRGFSIFRQNDVKEVVEAQNEDKNKEKVSEILRELDGLIGLSTVKKLIREIRAFVEIQKRRSKEKLATEPLVLHMIFRGNPGTGKTTVARIVGKLFKEIGVLQKGHIIEVERADLVGEYIGHTAQKTRELLKRALGGVLFVDEAYSLARGGEKDFGKESIDCLVKAMEDQKDNLILILAGYKNEMDWFLQTNPGLRSRFPIHIDFPDYNVEELMQIADNMLTHREYKLTVDARMLMRRGIIDETVNGNQYNGNARFVRNMIERAIRRQSVRLYKKSELTKEDLLTIFPSDLRND